MGSTGNAINVSKLLILKWRERFSDSVTSLGDASRGG